MKFIAGGVRGTAPIANKSFTTYGGDTTSYLVQSDLGDQVVVDLGSGFNNLFPYLKADAVSDDLLVLITHFHLDHLIGLVLLPNLNGAKTNVTIMAREHGEFDIESVVNDLIKPPYWPLGIQAMSGAVHFGNLADTPGEQPVTLGDLQVRWCPQSHPGGSTAYRCDESATGKSVVIATDLEWQKSTEAQRQTLLDLCTNPGPADLLVMDGQFQQSEYHKFEGWGHSTWADVIEVASASQARQILIAHHAPQNTDDQLRELEALLESVDLNIRLARQDEVVDL